MSTYDKRHGQPDEPFSAEAREAATDISDWQGEMYGPIQPGFAGPDKLSEIEWISRRIASALTSATAALQEQVAALTRELSSVRLAFAEASHAAGPESVAIEMRLEAQSDASRSLFDPLAKVKAAHARGEPIEFQLVVMPTNKWYPTKLPTWNDEFRYRVAK